MPENIVNKRKTFAIISHPDAGKTTLTEKLLLFGGAIQQAGAVKARGENRRAHSDWMKVEQERGQSNDIQSTLNNATDKLGRPKPKRETRIYKGVPVPVVRVVAMGRDGNTGKPRTGCRAAGHDGKVLTAYQHEGETDQECMDRWADIYLSRIAQENNK